MEQGQQLNLSELADLFLEWDMEKHHFEVERCLQRLANLRLESAEEYENNSEGGGSER